MPIGFFKSTAALVLFAVSFVVLVDAFVCTEAAAETEGAPVECCAQCCPRHHLVPLTPSLEKTLSESLLENLSLLQTNPPLFLLVKSIFHPPKLPLV